MKEVQTRKVLPMAAAVQGHTSPTFGWDTVFAVPVSKVNAAIASKKTSPPKLVYQSNTATQFQMQADFGNWTLIAEGDGPIIRVALPMNNLTGSYLFNGQSFSFSCANVTGIIEIELNFLPHDGLTTLYDANGVPLTPPKAGTTRNKLMARTVTTNPADPVAAFVVMNFTSPLSLPSARISIESAFLTWCNENLGQFAHVFAVVDINDKIATGRWAFCKPHTTSYAVVDKIDKTDSYLGVLCMTSSDPVPAVQQISAFVIPDNCESSFLISARRVLNDLLIPSMNGVWPNLDANDLEVASDDKTIELKSGKSFSLPDFVASDGNTYSPVMSTFRLEIMGDQMQIDTYTEVEVSLGIYATCTATYWYSIGLGANSKGEQTLTFAQAQTPAKTSGTRHDPAIDVIKTILIVISIVLVILTMIVDAPLGLLLGVLLAGIAVGQYEIGNIQMTHKGDAPGLDDLTNNFSAPIVWSDSKDFTLKSVGLSEALQLGGTWNIN
jgi:Clostridium P-47 protein